MKCGVINMKIGLLIKVVFLLDSNTTSIKQQSLKLDKTKQRSKVEHKNYRSRNLIQKHDIQQQSKRHLLQTTVKN